MFLASKASTTTSGLSIHRSVARGRSLLEVLSVHVSSFSSSTPTQKKDQPSSSSFRPRRRTPKNFHQSPTLKHRSKKANPINIGSANLSQHETNSDKNIDQAYGKVAGEALRLIQRAKKRGGDITQDTVFPSAEDAMRAADYLTADVGTTEDLVGERRAMMDAWDAENAEQFQKDLDELVEEQSEMSFKYLPWKEDEKEAKEGNANKFTGFTDDDMEVDPHQKAFGPWSDTIVRVDRVQKVQRGGTMVRYRALVIGGALMKEEFPYCT